MSALTGIRVIELASERCAFAGKLLADMGADVILVEPPGGDTSRSYPPFLEDQPGPDRSLYWWHYNTSKRGIVLDLEREEAQAAFRRLAETADVLVESEPIGRLERLDLDYPQLSTRRPELIHASITPFGRENSRREELATDLTILAGGGPVWSCGYDDHSIPPIRGGGNQGYQTACHYAVMSVLTALLHRGAGGDGQFIDVSQHAAANVTTEMSSYHWLVDQSVVQRQTGRHAMPIMTMPVQMACADGRYVCGGVPPRTPEGFGQLLGWLRDVGLEAALPEAIFLQRATERESIDFFQIGVDDEVTAIFSAAREALALLASHLDAQSFFQGAQKAGVTAGVIYSPEEAYEDPHFVDRGFQVEVEHPELGRSIRYPGAPYKLPASPWAIHRRAPRLNEHAEEVWKEIGVSPTGQ
ncbi:MAG: CoA transferase [Deltaproteobacteria bacterium]|jgi:crotonobetainyl-CoA:carnitine CoA-transferase CaiB-like acyl-CoA transferase|nr:CoA transferase [Deltaproteobacteria bacterium]